MIERDGMYYFIDALLSGFADTVDTVDTVDNINSYNSMQYGMNV